MIISHYSYQHRLSLPMPKHYCISSASLLVQLGVKITLRLGCYEGFYAQGRAKYGSSQGISEMILPFAVIYSFSLSTRLLFKVAEWVRQYHMCNWNQTVKYFEEDMAICFVCASSSTISSNCCMLNGHLTAPCLTISIIECACFLAAYFRNASNVLVSLCDFRQAITAFGSMLASGILRYLRCLQLLLLRMGERRGGTVIVDIISN